MTAPHQSRNDGRMTPLSDLPEDALEPVGLIRQSGVVLRTGRLMLSAGT